MADFGRLICTGPLGTLLPNSIYTWTKVESGGYISQLILITEMLVTSGRTTRGGRWFSMPEPMFGTWGEMLSRTVKGSDNELGWMTLSIALGGF